MITNRHARRAALARIKQGTFSRADLDLMSTVPPPERDHAEEIAALRALPVKPDRDFPPGAAEKHRREMNARKRARRARRA